MSGCLGWRNIDGEYDCEYDTDINCEDCMYGPYEGKVDGLLNPEEGSEKE